MNGPARSWWVDGVGLVEILLGGELRHARVEAERKMGPSRFRHNPFSNYGRVAALSVKA